MVRAPYRAGLGYISVTRSRPRFASWYCFMAWLLARAEELISASRRSSGQEFRLPSLPAIKWLQGTGTGAAGTGEKRWPFIYRLSCGWVLAFLLIFSSGQRVVGPLEWNQ